MSNGLCHCHLRALSPMAMTFQVHMGMTVTAATTFYRMRQLSHIRAQVQSVRDLDEDSLYHFTYNVSFLERYINTMTNWGMRDFSQAGQCMPLYESALAFIYTAFRDIPISSPILSDFATRVRRDLASMGREIFCQYFSAELLLWILFLMTWISQRDEDRLWFSNAMAWLIIRLKLSEWEQVKKVLTEFCMLECVCEAPYHKIWMELEHGVRKVK